MQSHELQNHKIHLIEETSFKTDHHLSFLFHSFPIRFYSNDKTLLTKLNDYLPNSWKIDDESIFDFYKIYHAPPPQEAQSYFCDESSSDVFYYTLKNYQFAIQRDFVAKMTKENKEIFCIFESEIDDGLHNFFRWFLSPLLLNSKKAMLHCAALINQKEEAYVFLGPSGAGKTTITMLGAPRLVLSDDMNLVNFSSKKKLLISPGGVGGLYRPQVELDKSFSIKGLFWLNQAQDNSISSLSLMKQTQYMLASFANLPWVNFDLSSQEQAFTCAEEIVKLQPLQQLNFKKEAEVWNLIDSF